VSAASVGAIQRGLLEIESQGADKFFGEPMLSIQDFLQTDAKGKGVINLLCASELMNAPRLYGTFLLWLLSELFEQLPEIGDPEKPKLVFFFDEAHLLFNEAPKVLIERMELLVRLIRSKGVGVYFVTQNPLDVPETVLGQLGNRVQHALRAFTPRDQKAVKASAQTMRANPSLDIEKAITEVAVGEALVVSLTRKADLASPSRPLSCCLVANWVRSRPSSAKPCSTTPWWRVFMKKPLTVSLLTRLSRVRSQLQPLAQMAHRLPTTVRCPLPMKQAITAF
jgi:DNA helicase HerA-like ATPase